MVIKNQSDVYSTITYPVITHTIQILLLLIGVLLSAGCTGSPPTSPNFGPWTAVTSNTTTGPSADTCSFDHLIGNTETPTLKGDSCYFKTHTPVDFLNDLRMHPQQPVIVFDAPNGWITLHDAELLMQEIDSDETAAPVVSPISSYLPFNQTSTVGNEALFLLEGFRNGKYPPALCSLYYFKPNLTEMKSWWKMYGKWGLINDRDAIRLIQNTYPEMWAYSSDASWPRCIRTERAPEGWYVAFIQEGSGLPILSAQCFYVGNNRTIEITGMVNQSIMVMPDDFSPQRCR